MLRSEAITAVRRFTDSEGSARFADGEIDDALKVGQLEAWQLAISSGWNVPEIEGSFTASSAGVVDLTTVKAMRLISVAVVSGQARLIVPPARFDQGPVFYQASLPVRITYVPRITYPASVGTSFTWGHANITAIELLERLMCALAAFDLKVKENEANPNLEKRIAMLKEGVANQIGVPQWTVRPMDGFSSADAQSGIAYVMTAPDTLQLVRV